MQLAVKEFQKKEMHLALFIHGVFFFIVRKEEKERKKRKRGVLFGCMRRT
jgi:preprotein translocase subunit YajC